MGVGASYCKAVIVKMDYNGSHRPKHALRILGKDHCVHLNLMLGQLQLM